MYLHLRGCWGLKSERRYHIQKHNSELVLLPNLAALMMMQRRVWTTSIAWEAAGVVVDVVAVAPVALDPVVACYDEESVQAIAVARIDGFLLGDVGSLVPIPHGRLLPQTKPSDYPELGSGADPLKRTAVGMRAVVVMVMMETKFDQGKLQQHAGWWRGRQLWAPAEGTRGGCAILLHRQFEAEILDQDAYIWGHWAWMQLRMGKETWLLMTVYAPSEPRERISFFEELPAIIPNADNIVLAGDFNTTLVPGLDSPDVAPRKTDVVMLSNLMAEQGLVDSYRTTHPADPGFTWFSSQKIGNSPPPKRRLDLVLTKGAAWDALVSISCIIETVSDHRPLVAVFELVNQLERGPGTFRLNTDLLNQQGILDWVAAHWRDWQQTKNDFETEELWLQTGLRITTRALDVFSRIQARGRRQHEQECRREIAEAEVELEAEPLAEIYWQHRRDRWLQKLEDLQVEQHVIWAQRAQEKGVIIADRMTKETFQRICPPRQNALIRELHHPFYAEAAPAKDSYSIGMYALTYFRDILTSRREPDLSLQQLQEEHDLWQFTAVKLPLEGRQKLEEPFTLNELWAAVKNGGASNSLRASPKIQGLDLGNGEQMKTGAIADDLLLVIEAVPETTREVKSLLDSYAALSVNWEKSVYFLPSDYELTGQDWGMRRVPPDVSERYLGVQVSLTDARPKQQTILQARVSERIDSSVPRELLSRWMLALAGSSGRGGGEGRGGRREEEGGKNWREVVECGVEKRREEGGGRRGKNWWVSKGKERREKSGRASADEVEVGGKRGEERRGEEVAWLVHACAHVSLASNYLRASYRAHMRALVVLSQ
ncbi:hypothetical protein CBR_g57651 [Chara braunii]|uniref:Endonuclease/exonuclease/phosphatase domain-containing protein n=1 Tax=Chara braunii TaxID=69332 RepID=A0A388MEF9_CHABU|nr:hypothetical protein CBR_g57651 [Chara braunii]|eukprot:GBG92893.1 hypothetical protein CBR_g57651 [Chara braunii]